MKFSRKVTAVVGFGLIVVVNAIVLVGVAYNRTGEAESSLRLTERELNVPSPWAFQKENSGLGLKLFWRVRDEQRETRAYYFSFAGPGSTASWLNDDKLKQLGVEMPPKAPTMAQKRAYEKQGSKEVFLVLEFDGPTYRDVLQRTRELAAAPQAEGKQAADAAAWQAKRLAYEESDSSRLFVIDAGLDRAALRIKYPDRSRYAIVQGRIHPPPFANGKRDVGRVERLAIDSVNVPLQFRPVFEGVTPRNFYAISQPYNGPRFATTVAFGKRLEPWLTAATRQP